MNPLNSIPLVWLAGVALAVVLAVLVNLATGAAPLSVEAMPLLRWVHVVAGILWVGLLYYFNFVQMPAVAAASADQSGPGPAAIGRYVLPRALSWFRWASVVTWVAGAAYLIGAGELVNAFSLGLIGAGDPYYGLRMGVGVWLGTVLLLNVWLVIWPNQKKVLGLVAVTSEADLAKAKRIIAITARINAILSLPMLLFMVAGRHGLAF